MGPCAKIMRALLTAGGAEVSDDDLAAASDYSPLSSSYIKAKSVLRGKDLMESSGKMHAARNILFLMTEHLSQNERIRRKLARDGYVTRNQCLSQFPAITRLGARICDLEAEATSSRRSGAEAITFTRL
jgi:hypothetical protein